MCAYVCVYIPGIYYFPEIVFLLSIITSRDARFGRTDGRISVSDRESYRRGIDGFLCARNLLPPGKTDSRFFFLAPRRATMCIALDEAFSRSNTLSRVGELIFSENLNLESGIGHGHGIESNGRNGRDEISL